MRQASLIKKAFSTEVHRHNDAVMASIKTVSSPMVVLETICSFTSVRPTRDIENFPRMPSSEITTILYWLLLGWTTFL